MAGFLVTFVGLPGTGKSTLVARVLETLHERGTHCDASDEIAFRKLMNKLSWAVREACAHPRFAWRSLKAILASRQRSLMDLVKMVANWFARSFLIRRAARCPDIHLFDEDMFQAFWSIAFSAQADGWQDGLPLPGTLLPVPSLVVVLESSLPTIERRLAARPGCSSRLEQWLPTDPGVLKRADRLMEDVKETIARAARGHAGMHVLLIDSDQDDFLEANALRVADYVLALSADQGMRAPSGDCVCRSCRTESVTIAAHS